MLVLSRRPNDEILFPNLGIKVRIVSVQGKRVRVGVEAPADVPVFRGELGSTTPDEAGLSARKADSESERRHTLKNQLNTAVLGLHLAQRQLAVGNHEAAEESMVVALRRLADLERGVSGLSDPTSDSRSTPQKTEATDCLHPRVDILLVEDDANEQALLRCLLELEGYRVHVANNGQEALECLQRISPRFVLLDMQMPRYDGKQTCDQIRKSAKFHDLPVFAVSASSPESVGLSIGQRGVNRWFPKPLDPLSLIRCLRQEFATVSA